MTAAHLRSTHLAGQPMSRETWLPRLMILEPERICDPQELAQWWLDREAAAEAKKAKRK